MQRYVLKLTALLIFVLPVAAQTADEIIAKYIKTIGGMEKIEAIKTIRRTGKLTAGGGFEAIIVQENKRSNLVREEFTFQGMTGVNAYDSKAGWKIEPWSGKKDVETLGEEELKSIIEDADFDGPLINYQQKGNKVEYLGIEAIEGTDTYKLKVTLSNGDIRHFYMDTDSGVPIKTETKRFVRGAEQESETILGDYKQVAGVYFPYSFESGAKGSSQKSQVTYEKIEANVPLDDNRFRQPVPAKPEGGKNQ